MAEDEFTAQRQYHIVTKSLEIDKMCFAIKKLKTLGYVVCVTANPFGCAIAVRHAQCQQTFSEISVYRMARL